MHCFCTSVICLFGLPGGWSMHKCVDCKYVAYQREMKTFFFSFEIKLKAVGFNSLNALNAVSKNIRIEIRFNDVENILGSLKCNHASPYHSYSSCVWYANQFTIVRINRQLTKYFLLPTSLRRVFREFAKNRNNNFTKL